MANKNSNLTDVLQAVQSDRSDAANAVSEAKQIQNAILDLLGKLGGATVTDDDILFSGQKIILPAQYDGRIGEAIDYLKNYERSQSETYEYSRTYRYRPMDGAHAFQATMMNHFGTAGIGKTIRTMFGDYPPELRTISVAHNKTAEVPWGQVTFSPLGATFGLGATKDREFGLLFHLSVEAPKRFRKHIAAFFELVENELKAHSIYKGKAVTGGQEPLFLDVEQLDRSKVIYSDETMTQLNANLWSLLEHTKVMRDLKLPLKRAVLLEGPYGTGKTLAGMLTAQTAQANGWTYILCRPGQDDLNDVLKTAQLYAPSVVWFEDVDVVASNGSAGDISVLLDTLDGITSKGAEVMAVFTTNFIERLQKGVLRPGRIDAIIHIGELDESGFTKLVKSLIPAHLLGEIDYAEVTKSFKGFLPAFAAEAINRSMRYSIARTGGVPETVNTADLVAAAEGLRPQLEQMNGASNAQNVVTIEDLLSKIESKAASKTTMIHGPDGEWRFKIDEELEDLVKD